MKMQSSATNTDVYLLIFKGGNKAYYYYGEMEYYCLSFRCSPVLWFLLLLPINMQIVLVLGTNTPYWGIFVKPKIYAYYFLNGNAAKITE